MKRRSSSASWHSFVGRRKELLEELASPVVHSFQHHDEVDEKSPMFDGSWDWHSAIQAAYSLHVLYRETRDPKYVDVLEFKIASEDVKELVRRELEYMRCVKKSDLYGLSQMLVLVRERERVTGQSDLRPLACEAVSLIQKQLNALTAEEAQKRVLADAYQNLSWNLIHLHLWANHSGDRELRKFVGKFLAVLLDDALDDLRPVGKDTRDDQEEFFPPALLRLAALSQLWDAEPEGICQWMKARLPDELWIEPVTEPRTVHAAGLNFSRAYCLWHIYRATADESYRKNFAHLVQYHISRHDLWMIDYYAHSHWVPQFGIRAISETFF